MEKGKEEKVLKELIKKIDNVDVAYDLINHYNKVDELRKNMVKSLNLLDKLYEEGKEETKEELRKVILDNFNDAKRSVQYTISSIIQNFEENEEENKEE